MSSAGLTTKVQPHARAGAIFHMPIRQGVGPRRYYLPRDLVAPARIIANRIDDRGHVLPPYRRQRLAGVQAFQLDEFFLMLFEKRRRALQDAAALGRPHSAPNLERRPGRTDGKVDVGLVALGHLGDGLFGGGIEVDGILAAAGRNVLAVDE